MSFYDAIICVTIIALITLAVLVYENARIPKKTKYKLYAAYIVIGIAALAEWGASKFSGLTSEAGFILHRMVKVLDYIISPVAGIFFIRQVCNEPKRERIYWIILLVNTLIQIIFLFTGNEWCIFYINENNDSVHGKLYIIYFIFYALIIAAALLETILYGRRYKNHNILSLILIVLVLITGLAFQELFGNGIKTDYISLALASAFLFIHYCEFYQLVADETIATQKSISVTDAMTGLLNRHAYSEKLVELKNSVHDEIVIYAIDVNGLKKANDSLGHEAGDELIKAVSSAIKNSFGKYGDCYRTGGDEFVCITVDANENPDSVCGEFRLILKNYNGAKIKAPTVSIGFACKSEMPLDTIDQLAIRADMRMYSSKRDFYDKLKVQ